MPAPHSSSSDPQLIAFRQGVDVHESRIDLLPDMIEQHLKIPCSALSGANIANEVARDAFSETCGKLFILFLFQELNQLHSEPLDVAIQVDTVSNA